MKRRTGSFLLALALLLLCPVLRAEASGFQQETRNSVVMIMQDIVVDGERLGYGTGTGFFIGETGKDPEYLVTNYHVIQLFKKTGGGQGESSLWVIFDKNNVEEAYVVDYDEEKDLALLRLGSPTDLRKPLQLEIPDNDSVGQNVYAVGFPAIADLAVDSVSAYSAEDATVTSGSISRLLTESGTGRRVLQMDASIHSGNSGGPLVNAAGNVIGINTFTIEVDGVKQEGLNYAVSVQELIPILERNQVAYALAAEREGLPVIALLAVLLAVLAIALLAVFLLRKKKKPAGAPTAVSTSVPANSAPSRTPFLRSLSSQHGGMQIPVSGQVLIGRDPASCRLVFREGTPGVSARHCSVSWDEKTGEFLVTDLKSSYGTWLIGGQRLSPGVPCRLKPGDSFYLGERSNEIRLEAG